MSESQGQTPAQQMIGEFSPSDSRAWVEKQAENAAIGLVQCGIVSRYRRSGHQRHRWQSSL